MPVIAKLAVAAVLVLVAAPFQIGHSAQGRPIVALRVGDRHGMGVRAATSRPAVAPIQRDLDGLVRAGVPGVIALVKDGGRTVRLVSGSARVSPRVPMASVDRFRVGSITKSFIATVLFSWSESES